jgi:hypothetical protein
MKPRNCEQLLPKWLASFSGFVQLMPLQTQDALVVSSQSCSFHFLKSTKIKNQPLEKPWGKMDIVVIIQVT